MGTTFLSGVIKYSKIDCGYVYTTLNIIKILSGIL